MSTLARIAPELPSDDLNEAVAYYEQKLGFKVALRLPGNEYAIVERDGVAIHLFAVSHVTIPSNIDKLVDASRHSKFTGHPSRRGQNVHS